MKKENPLCPKCNTKMHSHGKRLFKKLNKEHYRYICSNPKCGFVSFDFIIEKMNGMVKYCECCHQPIDYTKLLAHPSLIINTTIIG